jgi:O-antigen/teichoic acid export membrane protein
LTDAATQVKHQATESVKWAFLGDLLPKALQPLLTIVLARLLTPSDFGIIGIATLAITLARMVESMGLNQALIQTDEDVEEAANVVFWSNLALSGLLYVIVFLTAPLAADFFAEPRVTLVLRVMGLQLVLSAFDDVQEALLRRNFRFRQLVGRRLIPALTPALVGIPLAIAGFGYWSLVAGTLTGTALGVVLLWKVSGWRPHLSFKLALSRNLFSFGGLVTAELLLGWLLASGDSVIAGHYLGVRDLGLYRVGLTIVALIFGAILQPLSIVAYPALSQLQSDQSAMRQSFFSLSSLLAVIVLPIAVGLSMVAVPISKVVLGQNWQGVEVPLQILAIMPGLSYLVLLHPDLYRAAGRPDITPKFFAVAILLYLPAYILAAPHGLMVFCLARAAVGIVTMPVHFFLAARLLDLPKRYEWDCVKAPLVGVLAMALVVYGLTNLLGAFAGGPGWLKLGALVSCGAVTYVAALWLADAELVRKFLRLTRQVVR